MLADPADVVEDSAQHRVHTGGAAAHFPVALLLTDELAVGQVHDAVAQPANAQAAGAAELVGGKVDAIQAPGFHIGQAVGGVLDGVADDEQIRLDLTGFTGDGLDIQHSAGDVGGHDDAQQAGVLVDQLDNIHRVDGAGAGVGLGNAQLLAVLLGGDGAAIECGGMLQLGGDDVGAGHVGDDGFGNIENDDGSGHRGGDAAALGVEHRGDILAGLNTQAVQIIGSGTAVAAAVGQVIDIAESFAGVLQAEGTAGVIKEQALALGERVHVHVVVFIADLGGQVGRHQLAVLDDIVHFAHVFCLISL